MRPLNEHQRMLADAAIQFAVGRGGPGRTRACRDRSPDFDLDVWREMAGLGWFSVLVPEADGGLANGLSEMGQLVYEWGATPSPEPLVASAVLALTLLIEGEGPKRDALLASTMQGDAVPALARMEPGASCTLQDGGWRVSGSARFVTPADASDFILVFPDSEEWPALALPAGTIGLTVQREARADGSAAAWLGLESILLPAASVVASGRESAAAAAKALDFALVMAAVSMAGTMRTVNAMTQEYLRTRTQFGKPIGSFQALQHKAVDMHIAEQMARDVAQHACTRIDAGCSPDERACLASRAKARAADALDRIARMAVQLHGAVGFTDEYDLSLHLNRALTFSAWLGNSDEHVRRYAAHAAPFEAADA